jgi:CBS domain containing-hemolysin-like protein
MDDGNPLLRVMIFVVFILLDAIFYGFGAAIQNVNDTELERQMEEGSVKARKLLHIVNRPTRFVNTIQVTTNLISMITGAYVLVQLEWSVIRALVICNKPDYCSGYFDCFTHQLWSCNSKTMCCQKS